VAAFGYATFLSYWGTQDLKNAFDYQNKVVTAQKAENDLNVQQFELGSPPAELGPYENALKNALDRLTSIASNPAERAPDFHEPANRTDFTRLESELAFRQSLGQEVFNDTVERNARTRNVSNALFALVALLFAFFVGRLRRAVEEGRSLVEGLQRAFIAEGHSVPNMDLGSVLISATRGSNVGGDTHDAFTFDRRFGMFLVADVSGKGIDAAVDTALIKYTIRTLFSDERDPGRILTKFARIYELSSEDPETFVVLFLAVIDLSDGSVRYASAGHEPAWVVRRNSVEQLPATGSIVGIAPEEAYGTASLTLGVGDALVVSTDGLTESRDARGKLLGAENVASWLSRPYRTAQGLADAVVRRLRRRSSRITDDLAILVARYEPDDARKRSPKNRPTVSALSTGEPLDR
jgi:serine phosphatase RsbU (regulator of sigma subunit)